MIKDIGRKLTQPLTNSLNGLAAQSMSVTSTAAAQGSGWINTQAGTSSSSGTITITDASSTQITPGQFIGVNHIQPPPPVGDMLQLIKTGDGEFVLTGSGDTLALLMEYFLQSPELWLRLAAMQAPPEKNDG